MNMRFDNIESVYLIGIGGIGMSALARYFHTDGKKVFGYDKVVSPIAEMLVSEGIEIHYDDDTSLIPSSLLALEKEKVLVIYTPAIPSAHKELNYFQAGGYQVMKRAKVLGGICDDKFTIAIAGTHGKTTVSTIAAHILKSAEYDFVAFLGGISTNYASNFIYSKNGGAVLAEADEYDKSFLSLSPDIAVLTSVDADHLDIYGEVGHMQDTYKEFLHKVKANGKVVLSKRASLAFQEKISPSQLIYSIDDGGEFYAHSIRVDNGKYIFSVHTPNGKINDVSLGLPGRHNVENAVAAVVVASLVGIDFQTIKAALLSFQGVKRRFEYQVLSDQMVYIDDYAHHPEELRVCIQSARELFPGKRIMGVFQPHLFSRTKDFYKGFAESLSLLDALVLLDIYPAREMPIKGVTSQMILDEVTIEDKKIMKKEVLVEEIDVSKTDVLLTLGAGDIDTIIKPLKQRLETIV